MTDSPGEFPTSIHVRVLGALDVTGLDRRNADAVLAQPKRLALLVYLALAPAPHFRRRDSIVANFWPELDEHHARGALRQALSFLRQALGAQAFTVRGLNEVGVSRTLVRFDVHDFEIAAAAGDHSATLSAYTGDFLDGVHVSGVAEELESWIAAERIRLRRMARDAARALCDTARAQRDAAASTRLAQRAYALSDHDERDLAEVVTTLAEGGDRAGALRVFAEYARELEDGIGAVPSAQLRTLVDHIRDGALPILPPVRSTQTSDPVTLANDPPEFRDDSSRLPMSWRMRVPGRMLAALVGGLAIAGAALGLRLGAARSQPSGAAPKAAVGVLPTLLSTTEVAREAYLRGQYLLSRRDTASIRMARDEFLNALDSDPAFADAWLALSYAYGTFAHSAMMPSSEAFARADAAARKALVLRPSSGMARVLLGSSTAYQQWLWDEGTRAVREGLAMDSLQADAHNILGVLLRVQGRFDEALAEARLAARLDPLARHFEYQIGQIQLCSGRYEDALATARSALSLGSHYPSAHFIAADALAGLGHFRAALAESDSGMGSTYTVRHERINTDSAARRVLDSMETESAKARIKEFERLPPERFVSPVDRANAYATLRMWPEAFRWLREAMRLREVNVSKVNCNTAYDPVRNDPRWIAMMREIGLPVSVRRAH